MKRRTFIQSAFLLTPFFIFHKRGDKTNLPVSKNNSPRFLHVKLMTSKFQEMYYYYTATLGFEMIERSQGEFTLRIGATKLTFQRGPDDQKAQYHFAINIPSNKFIEGKYWLKKRASLLIDSETQSDEVYFENWDAHSVYFEDPSGNIVELIARHSLSNDSEGKFTTKDLLCISEIGVPTENPAILGDELNYSFGLDRHKGSPMYVGDENGMFVIPPVGKYWIPNRTKAAKAFPVEVMLNTPEKKQFTFNSDLYSLKGV